MAIQKNKRYTVQQAALALGKTEASIRRLIRLQRIPSRSEGRRLYILGSDLLKLGLPRPPKPTEALPPPPPPPDSKSRVRAGRMTVTAQTPPEPPIPPPPDSKTRVRGRVSPVSGQPGDDDDGGPVLPFR